MFEIHFGSCFTLTYTTHSSSLSVAADTHTCRHTTNKSELFSHVLQLFNRFVVVHSISPLVQLFLLCSLLASFCGGVLFIYFVFFRSSLGLFLIYNFFSLLLIQCTCVRLFSTVLLFFLCVALFFCCNYFLRLVSAFLTFDPLRYTLDLRSTNAHVDKY